jgi:hypothetical protein
VGGPGYRLNTTELLALLCDGRPEAVAPALKLTLYQANRVLRARRDPEGVLVITPKSDDARLSAEEVFTLVGIRRGLPRWRLALLWQEQLRRAAEQERGPRNGR